MRSDGYDTLILQIRASIEGSPNEPPLSKCEIADVEAALGFHLHPLLRRVYAEVAGGGVGPGSGLLAARMDGGLKQHVPLGSGLELIVTRPPSLVSTYRRFCENSGWHARLVPICDWDGEVWSCLDRATGDGEIVTCDSLDGPTTTAFNIFTWLSAWAEGADLWETMYGEDRYVTMRNPFSPNPVTTYARGVAKGRPWSP
jgi:hypothetical protein